MNKRYSSIDEAIQALDAEAQNETTAEEEEETYDNVKSGLLDDLGWDKEA
ncbi:MAG: hypothetical protein FWE31_04680 [Firmicutes bacterium]|nr:hypothetical protein [Bacillota bacterium]